MLSAMSQYHVAALIPLLLVLGLLASGRAGALVAGLAGLAGDARRARLLIWPQAPAAAVPERCGCARSRPAAWLAWQVIAIIATGMFFHRCTLRRAPRRRRRDALARRRGGCGRSASCWRPSPKR